MTSQVRSIVQTDSEWLPHGSVALTGAWYVQFDYDGKPTGIWISVGKGDRLPAFGPQGSTWRIAQRAV